MPPPTAASNHSSGPFSSSPSSSSSIPSTLSPPSMLEDIHTTPETTSDPLRERSLTPSSSTDFKFPAPPAGPPASASASSSASHHHEQPVLRPSTSTPDSRRKRLSLNFPIIPAGFDAPPSRHCSLATPSASGASTPPAMAIATAVPGDSAGFLTALAAQERRVLELREELQKAESELEQLKQQWVLHEATKKRREIASEVAGSYNHSQELREAMSSPTRKEEFERLQQIRNGTKEGQHSRRKVLPSQRHQRTLSLLSPDRGRFDRPLANMEEERRIPLLSKRHTVMNPTMPIRGETSSAMSHNPRALSLDTNDINTRQRRRGQDAILSTGKQIADDFKEGLWTFIEDLKQATVGDDPAYHHPNGTRRIPSRNNLLAEAEKARNPQPATPSKGKQPENPESSIAARRASNSSTSSSSYSYSETQSYRWSTSTTLSEPGVMTPHTQASTPRTSTRLDPLWSHICDIISEPSIIAVP
ncbi:hypothetical protein EX30DRAFT_343648 [Ascodesmis nigricans]|uniref:DUF4048 domain-containing protein n=1 Tax=Ascodesmis nigricans TaxID=341454 RepID=A0A4S2MLV3_9PEZI|nr:hypothetical protein EX30DRAFT_343648 [Ascodesmis nigricans]